MNKTRPGITRKQAVALFGSRKALQQALELKSHASIINWPENGLIPNEHYLRIRYQIRPEAFDEKGRLKPLYKKAA